MSDEIEVRFKTTEKRMYDLMYFWDFCSGDVIQGELIADPTYPDELICPESLECKDCRRAFIDRITVGDENKEIETWRRATNYWHENWKELARFCKKNVQAEIPKGIKALIDGLEGE